MAQSPAHKWGQIIGEFLEQILESELNKFSRKHKLYLDTKGERPARPGKKVSWIDSFENSHELDFVLERGGTRLKIGDPVAFIEIAWRRYTKHSKNKAQEIQGAIMPLVATHKNFAPFIGVMLAGEFTGGALTQLKSLGFNVLYFPYDLILKGFREYGMDASSEETTSERDFQSKINTWKNFKEKDKLGKYLLRLNSNEVNAFFVNLEKAVSRFITSVIVVPLHGKTSTLSSIEEAIEFVENYNDKNGYFDILKYEIMIKYNNNDKIEGIFTTKEAATEFLISYAAPKPKEK
jgi:hypothetical protein